MKVVLLGASNSRSAGGLYATMSSLSKALSEQGVDVSVLGVDDEHSPEDRAAYGQVPLPTYTTSRLPLLHQLGYSHDIHKRLEELAPDIIHLQGIWMYHSAACLRHAKHHPGVKVIIEPHGMLDPWAVRNSYWKKWIVGHLFEFRNLHRAHCIHALCQSELQSIRAFGLSNPIAVIPNGITLPTASSTSTNSLQSFPILSNSLQANKKTLLFIGRIHPKKGLKELVEAVAILKVYHPQWLDHWEIKIYGWDQLNHSAEIQELIRAHSLQGHISLLGPLFGQAKEQALRSASAFILPSHSEGLPMGVLEAWAYGLPVVMTPQCNLPEGFTADAAIRCNPEPQSIADALETLDTLSPTLITAMGQHGRTLVEHQFTWSTIATQTITLYRHLLGLSPRPDFLHL